MIFYTADPHFGYEPIIEQTGRPFSTVQEMDETLIRNWNTVVSEQDTVYLIGDVGSYRTPFPSEQLSKLRGHKHLIRGNHDASRDDQQILLEHFETVTDFLEINDGEHYITLCHYPIVYVRRGYMIHGHIHNVQKEVHRILTQLPQVLNAGVDINAFRPVTLEELIKNNQDYYHDPQRGRQMEWPKKPKWNAEFHPLPVRQ